MIYDVVIAGAGPVGSFLACELQLARVSVRLNALVVTSQGSCSTWKRSTSLVESCCRVVFAFLFVIPGGNLLFQSLHHPEIAISKSPVVIEVFYRSFCCHSAAKRKNLLCPPFGILYLNSKFALEQRHSCCRVVFAFLLSFPKGICFSSFYTIREIAI